MWSQASLSIIKLMSSLYNQSLKIVAKKPVRSHHCDILEDYELLSFDNFLKFSSLKLVFKCLHNLAPAVLCQSISRQHSRVTRGTVNGNCKTEWRKTSFGQSAFSIKGSQFWNTLPTDIKLTQDIKSFNGKVEGWLWQNQKCVHY